MELRLPSHPSRRQTRWSPAHKDQSPANDSEERPAPEMTPNYQEPRLNPSSDTKRLPLSGRVGEPIFGKGSGVFVLERVGELLWAGAEGRRVEENPGLARCTLALRLSVTARAGGAPLRSRVAASCQVRVARDAGNQQRCCPTIDPRALEDSRVGGPG